jgi:flagellar hook-associated protein 1 FlgK
MGTSILGIGISGLNAAQAGLSTTSHNISNASTPGFSRQSTVQTTLTPQYSGAGYFGQGTNIETVRRSYSSFLDAQLREAQTQSSYLDSFLGQISNVDNLLSDASTGLTPAMNEFFSSVNALGNNPADIPARQQLLASAQTLAGRYRDLAGQLDNLRDGANAGISGAVSQVNSQAASIAQLNDRIRTLQGSGQAPNDLLDQRDALVHDLAAQIRINVVPLADGTLNVFLPNGQGIVMGTQNFAIAAQTDPANPANVTVGMVTAGGFKPMRESDLSGGAIGGILAFRNQVLDAAENALGLGAAALASAFNAQHMVGQDRNGAIGAAFFSAGTGPQVFANANNAGTGQVAAVLSNIGAATTSDYRLQYDGANYTVTRISDNTAQVFASLPQVVDGVSFSIASGVPAAGDSFLIQPVRTAAQNFSTLISDTASIAAALPVRGSAAAANGSASVLAVTGVAPPAGANLTQPVTITFTGPNTFDVTGVGTGNPTGLTFTPGMTLSYNGWSATMRGSPAAGDVFTVAANIGGIGDNGNLVALGGIDSARVLGGGSTSIHDSYAQMVTRVGTQAHAAQVDSKAQASVAGQALAAQQSVSGVNLDEEAAALLKYQQAYQAAGKVIATANSLFDEILAIMR